MSIPDPFPEIKNKVNGMLMSSLEHAHAEMKGEMFMSVSSTAPMKKNKRKFSPVSLKPTFINLRFQKNAKDPFSLRR